MLLKRAVHKQKQEKKERNSCVSLHRHTNVDSAYTFEFVIQPYSIAQMEIHALEVF